MLIDPTLGASTVKTTSYYLHRSEDSIVSKARKSPTNGPYQIDSASRHVCWRRHWGNW